jgi:hypothetical protein
MHRNAGSVRFPMLIDDDSHAHTGGLFGTSHTSITYRKHHQSLPNGHRYHRIFNALRIHKTNSSFHLQNPAFFTYHHLSSNSQKPSTVAGPNTFANWASHGSWRGPVVPWPCDENSETSLGNLEASKVTGGYPKSFKNRPWLSIETHCFGGSPILGDPILQRHTTELLGIEIPRPWGYCLRLFYGDICNQHQPTISWCGRLPCFLHHLTILPTAGISLSGGGLFWSQEMYPLVI